MTSRSRRVSKGIAVDASGLLREKDIGDVSLAGEHEAQGVEHGGAPHRLRHEPRGARLQSAAHGVAIRLARENDDGGGAALRLNGLQAGQPIHAGHAQIEQDEIEIAGLAQDVESLRQGGGVADLQIIGQPLEKLFDRIPDQVVIIGQEDAHPDHLVRRAI
jgi:hypothetical protein